MDEDRNAVVIGGGIAGLLAARVLADHFARVTVLERDALPAVVADRRGAVQGRHVHALLARGQQLLEGLFPGLTAELAGAGARVGDVLGGGRLYFSGHRLRSAPSGLVGVNCSRALLEHHIRARLARSDTVTIHDRCAVAGLVTDGRASTVVGVRLHEPAGDGRAEIGADLVVDAAGRTSAVPGWLDALGCPSPPVDQVHVDVAYATRRYRMGAGHLSGDVAIINAPTPAAPRAGALALVEDDVGMVTLAGIGGDRPPLDADGFAAFARSLAFRDIGEAIAGAEPLDEPVPHRFPASTWRRYDRAGRLPEGLAVLGDGVCSFNPIYGQGMTIAALGASALGTHLERHGRVRPRRFQRDLARIVAPAWEMAAGSDLQLPGVRGRRRRLHGPVSAYVRRLHAAAAHDAGLSQAFVRVAGMVDPPTALLRPRVAARVLRGSTGAELRPR